MVLVQNIALPTSDSERRSVFDVSFQPFVIRFFNATQKNTDDISRDKTQTALASDISNAKGNNYQERKV